jgi:hypothetical protein
MTAFLCDPLKTGANSLRIVIPFQAIAELWEFLAEKAKENHRRLKVKKPTYDNEYFEFAQELGLSGSIEKDLDDMLSFLIGLKDITAEPIKKWGESGVSVIAPEYFTPSTEGDEGYFFFAPQTYFAEIQDAISIRMDFKAFPDLIINASSLTPQALSEFKAFVRAIPFPKSKPVFLNECKHFSNRFVLDLYPAVAGMWVDEIAHKYVSRDIIDLLNGAVEYMDKREWQMSIILSAFSVETMLVDIYEELLHKDAPPAPIGYLVQEIEKTKKFPSTAIKKLKIVNRMRITAVHRGMTTFNMRDSIVALMGAIQFIFWCCFEGVDFCNLSEAPTEH